MYEFGFIGAGNMGGALALAVAKKIGADKVCVCEKHVEKIRNLVDMGVKSVDAKTLASNSKYVVLGMKPQVLANSVCEIKEFIMANENAIVVSMAAGTSIEKINGIIENKPVIRIMPNTPCLVDEGVILYCCNTLVSKEVESYFVDVFSNAGIVESIEEIKIDAASALSGCGPAFVYMFAEALADGAVECGIKRDLAVKLVAKTIAGSGKMIETFGHIGDLKDAVCSPGGTTIAGVHALEKGGLRSCGMDAVTASYKKTIELSCK